MRTTFSLILFAIIPMAFVSCENVDIAGDIPQTDNTPAPVIRLDDVAYLLSELPIGSDQMGEVHDAVSVSTDNGYDEEYTMQDLFREPGTGVGANTTKRRSMSAPATKSAKEYQNPMRELLKDAVENHAVTKGTRDILNGASADAYLDALQDSDIQIYWPYAEDWDWEALPIITFAPDDDSEANVGYEVVVAEDGSRTVKEVVVTEDVAKSRPVWVVNRNDDSDFTSLELMKKNDPAWGNNGGNIIVTPHGFVPETKADEKDGHALLLKYVILKRHLDSWFAGASELVVRIGAVENFKASTEAELKLYTPQITDFVVVVKRSEVTTIKEFNAVLVSSWTPQLESCGFMVTEDDGGTRTTWSCSANVKVQSKSYGFDISLPLNQRDDIVWRGSLTYNYITANNNRVSHLGDMDACFEILDY